MYWNSDRGYQDVASYGSAEIPPRLLIDLLASTEQALLSGLHERMLLLRVCELVSDTLLST